MTIKILVSCLMGPGTIEAKLIPLSNSNFVSQIIVLRKEKGPKINKVIYIKLPSVCRIKIINIILSPIILTYLAIIHKVDLILSYHFIPHAFFAFISSLITKLPFNVSQTGYSIQKYAETKRFSKVVLYILQKTRFINVPGQKSKSFWISKGIDEKKIFVLHSKIDADKYKPLKVEKVFDFIYLGRLSKEKQVKIIINGIFELKNKGMDVNLVVVGDGPQMNELMKLTNKLNISNQVTFIGFSTEPEIWLNKAKIFLLSSQSEGLPTALMQAMSCKLVSIAPDVGNISDLIENNHNGFMYEKNNIKLFYNLMEENIKNYYNLNFIRENARNKILMNYTYDSATILWNQIIESKIFKK